ncbi:dehydrogenase E1 component superfamily [Trichinella spiralis]|uniref:dehydrogenase E1 component superfamily n=1 Tax=Trichinella spiralis TaxID=6334 RepID=UPI0001EFE4C3|nr:dehydrogenase E1 component superfamily [Trichinella spiralis]
MYVLNLARCVPSPAVPFKTHKLDSAPAQQVTVTRDEAMKYLREMLLEAVAVGMKAAMNEDDSIITAYRCHGWSLLSGITLKQVFAELAALNMAKLWHLPCVFVCENNGYGMGTSVERSSASTEYYTRGDYVPGLWNMEKQIRKEVEKALAEALQDPEPPLELLYTDVYKDTPDLVLRGTSAEVVVPVPKNLTADVLKTE